MQRTRHDVSDEVCAVHADRHNGFRLRPQKARQTVPLPYLVGPARRLALLSSESTTTRCSALRFRRGCSRNPPALPGLTSILAELLSSGSGRDAPDDIGIRLDP